MSTSQRRTEFLHGVALVLPLLMAISAPASAQTQEPEPAEGEDAGIVVTGIRASLQESIALKRNADQIVDVITAEDIGKLPDENIAESIQRVTGVQITRDGGEGKGVNIRGLSAQTQINGRVALGLKADGQAARDFDFRSLGAEFVQTIEVSKSPVASQPEGALGGTINLITRKPLDFKKPTFSISADGQYSEFAKTLDPRASVFFTDKFIDDTIGIALSANYSRRRLRTDNFQMSGGWVNFNLGTPTGFDFNRDGSATDVLRPNDMRLQTSKDTRTRYGVDGTIQWRPTEDFELRLDGNYSRFENIHRNHFFRTLSGNFSSFVPGSLRISDQGTLLGATYTNQLVQVDGRYEPEPQNTYFFGTNAKWTTGKLTLEGDVSYTKSNRKLISHFMRFSSTVPATVTYDFPNATTPPSITLASGTGSAFDLFTPANYVPDIAFDRIIAFKQDEKVARADATYAVDTGILTSIQAGIRATFREVAFRVVQSANQTQNRANPSFYDQATGRRLTIADAPLSQFTGPFPFANGVFPQYSTSFPRRWLVGAYPEGSADVGSTTYLTALRLQDFGGLLNSNSEQSDIGEDTLAGYLAANLGGSIGSIGFAANIGGRYVRTRLESAGLLTSSSGIAPITVRNDYNSFLPAANLKFDVTSRLVMRLAFAKVIERPDLTQLATGFTLNQSTGTASAGNPTLNPYRATQYDLSLEYYTGRDGSISAAFFAKDVSDFISSQTTTGTIPGVLRLDGGSTFLITQPVNGGSATIRGFELAVQQPFSFLPAPFDGFGVIANYTYSDAESASGQPFPRLSKHSYNLIGYYEQAGLSARVAYNWRSRFASFATDGNAAQINGLFEYNAPAGYLDATVSYEITPQATIVLEGANLLNTVEIRYLDQPERLRDLRINDRRFSAGVRLVF